MILLFFLNFVQIKIADIFVICLHNCVTVKFHKQKGFIVLYVLYGDDGNINVSSLSDLLLSSLWQQLAHVWAPRAC